MVKKIITAEATSTFDSGFTKFGITPGGGGPIGVFEGSIPGGRPAMLMVFPLSLYRYLERAKVYAERLGEGGTETD